MTALDISSANDVLKEYYSNQRVTQLTYKDAPLYAMLKKVKDFEGSSYPLPMRVADPTGRSGDFALAQANKNPSLYDKFSLTRKKNYSLASISSEAIMASASNPGAFLRLATAEIDGAMSQLKRSLSWAVHGDGSGAIGSCSSTAPTSADPSVITLANPEDIVKFEVGMILQARSGGTTRVWATTTPTAAVIAVDRDLGTFTVDVDNSGNTDTIQTGDTFNVYGDYNAMLTGVAGWIPSSTPSSAAFFGVDRTVDVSRLAGCRIASTGKPLDEALIDGARRVGRSGGAPDAAFLDFTKYAALEKTLGSRVRYQDVDVAGISFRAIEISGPQGTIKCFADRDQSVNRIELMQMSDWALYSLGEPAQILNLDGNSMLREASADAYEVRIASFSQVGCVDPGNSGVLTFS